ncbi:MAG TPA: energy-coupling factor transporter ATPase [Kaistia sp.]|nr:energy-coupling factor transporter ATPase [Kaistia sp.]
MLADAVEPKDERPLPLVTFEQVGYAYAGAVRKALDGIDLTIARGEFVGIVGATGAGKSTLCLTLNGIVPQFFGGSFFGTVTVAGCDTLETATSRLAATIGMVFEDPETQITATTVEGEVAFALENLRVPTEAMQVRVAEALRAVGLAGLERKHPARLSGGQKQRLAIAAALALSPDLIVLDEPTSQLDPIGTSEVFALLSHLNRERGITIIVASHASEELAAVSSRILLLSGGRVVRDGSPQEVLGDVALLQRHDVRPPDIAQAFAAVAARLQPGTPPLAPVTLAEAPLAFARFGLAFAAAENRQQAALPSGGAPVLEAVDVSHVYPDGTAALRGVDLSIRRGEFVALGGRNGCGKSTLIRHFLHLLTPSAGLVRVDGADVAGFRISDLACRIGYVSQNAHQQLFCDSVREEVAFALKLMKRPKGEVDAAVDYALDAMRLVDLADRHPASLSRGDRLRLAIAATLAPGPDILIFDEPTTGQDWAGALAILDICRSLNARGKTVLLVTHHLYLLAGYAERLVVMAQGRVVLDGPLVDVLYAGPALEAASLAPPQTVSFAAGISSLAAAGRRPLSPASLAALVDFQSGVAL